MPTLAFLTGWEHGVLSFGGGGLANDWANASVVSTTPRTGTYSLRLNPSAAVAYWEKAIDGATPNVLVARLYVRFASVPNADMLIFNDDNANSTLGVGFKVSDGKFCTHINGAYAAGGGATVVAGQWYRIDVRLDCSTGTHTADAQVDGTALTQSSGAFAASTFNAYKVGPNGQTPTMDMFVDDLVVSHTAGDYPIGEGSVRGYSPSAVGVHNLETSPSGAFLNEVGGSESAITNAESTSWQSLDDVPLGADEDHVLVENDGALTAAHYLEYAFADSSESGAIQAVRAIVTLRQDAAANCAIVARLREGGSDATIFSGDVNSAFRIYKAATFATKPSGGAWTDPTFDATTLRYGFTTDADGRVRLDSAMLEVAFGPGGVDAAPALRRLVNPMRWG